jgi:hypothetical protein
VAHCARTREGVGDAVGAGLARELNC